MRKEAIRLLSRLRAADFGDDAGLADGEDWSWAR
jgi:hypothetical protein